MWEAILVGLIVITAVLYAAWKLLPAASRLRLAQRVVRIADGRPAMGWLQRAARRVESAQQARLTGCGNCGAAIRGNAASACSFNYA